MDAKNLDSCSRDLISCLPDELLGSILSLVPTKQAASTSLLSKRWRNVFRLVDNLDFDDSVLVHAGECKDLESYAFPERFENFVDQTLALHCDYPIKKFSLKCHVGSCYDSYQKTCVGRWVSNVVDRGVLELDLRIKDGGVHYFLPPQIFTCKTLVKLKLGTRLNQGKLPSCVSLPSLKTLFIDTIFLEYEDLCGVLLAGCPVLEELLVHHTGFKGTPIVISSPTVRRLTVNCGNPITVDSSRTMSFDLPKLVYLEYSYSALAKYPQVNLESIVEAKLDLDKVLRPDVTDLIMGIRNVEKLHLSPDSVDVIYCYCRYELLVFNNLVKLSFGVKYNKDWKLLAYLLKHSPKLETLIIQNLYGEINDDVFMHVNKVKVLRILGYRGTARELKNLKSFLLKTDSLELVQVDVTEKDDCIIMETKRHLLGPGVSFPSKCQIKVK